MRRQIPQFEIDIDRLGQKGVGIGTNDEGRVVHVRGGPPGSRVIAQVFDRKKGTWFARRVGMVRPPSPAATPKCVVFGACGGCQLQEMPLESQRAAKVAWAANAVAAGRPTPTPHPVRGAPSDYGYRNRLELTFGNRRWLVDADMAAGLPMLGNFLGFHAPTRFDRIVDVERCEIASERVNLLLAAVRRVALDPDAPPAWDTRAHKGFWRFLGLREGTATNELMVILYTSSDGPDEAVEAVANELLAVDLGEAKLVGVVWKVDDGHADVARGEVRRVWGRPWFYECLGDTTFRLSPESFFQTSTKGAEVLVETIGEALGRGGTLVDLYCGTGTIGLSLASRYSRVVGVEEVEAAVVDARANAADNSVNATFIVSRVEDVLASITEVEGPRRLCVDPPRAGLHPRVAKALAEAHAERLVYVACNPESLGRDRVVLEAGGWRMTDLWVVDLFPQTGHVEVVARFDKDQT